MVRAPRKTLSDIFFIINSKKHFVYGMIKFTNYDLGRELTAKSSL